MRHLFAVPVAICLTTSAASGVLPTFTDVTYAARIIHAQGPVGPAAMTGGAAAGDYDNDGDPDLFFTRYGSSDLLYRNNGDGTFTNVSLSAGFTEALPTNGAAWGDIDNDGDLDLYVTAVGSSRFFLYVNDGHGGFVEDAVARNAHVVATTSPSGAPTQMNGQSVTFGDYDRDGFLDIFTTTWGGSVADSGSRLLRNRGGAEAGWFDDVTAAVGLNQYRSTSTYRFTGRFTDLDSDGHTDLVIAADFGTSQLFWNRGDNTFVDGTLAAGVGTDQNGMGSTIADVDGDGDLDWFVTAISQGGELGGNRLYLNNGDRTFTDATSASGVRNAGWGWGTSFFEFDNDGDFDLVATNGWNSQWGPDLTVFWENDGHGVFSNVSAKVVAGTPDSLSGRGLLHLDYDTDGDLDLVIVNNGDFPILYRNDGGNEQNYLRIKTVGTVSNRDGIGALITVTRDLAAPATKMVWEIDGGSSFLSQNELTAHFGLGESMASVGRVEITWPSGQVDVYDDVPVNQSLLAIEGESLAAGFSGDFNRDGRVDAADYTVWRDSAGGMGQQAADADHNRIVDGADLVIWRKTYGAGATTELERSTPTPEPSSQAIFLLGGLFAVAQRRHA